MSTTVQNKRLLTRRNSLTNSFQAIIDGLIVVILIASYNIFEYGYFTFQYIALTLFLLLAMAVIYDYYGVYRRYTSISTQLLTLAKAWAIAFAGLLVLGFLLKSTDHYSRVALVSLFIIGYLAQIISHVVQYNLQLRFRSKQQTNNALIIGTGQLADYISERINANPWLHQQIVGVVSLEDVKKSDTQNNKSANSSSATPVLGELSDINSVIAKHHIKTVYIAVPLEASPIVEKIYFDLLDTNIDVHWAPNIFALNLINHSVKEIAGLPIITLSETPLTGTNWLMKTIEDKVFAAIALILISPLMLITAVCIKVESKGPVFFRQRRTGWDGVEFKIWKFRSMRPHTEGEKIQQATKGDSRITRVGRFIRRTSIDELPQLFNVLSGQMSLVGPRPHAVQHNEEYAEQITAYLGRHRIKPGITGLAQVRGYRGETKELDEMIKRVQHDLEYINHWSIGLDISILLRTVWSLRSDKAY